jgi:hypothetical protein
MLDLLKKIVGQRGCITGVNEFTVVVVIRPGRIGTSADLGGKLGRPS